MEPDERRQEILACAVRLFGERPYADVSTTDVARQAGVARGLVNHYFGTKRGLYLEVVRVMVTIPEMALEHLPHGDLPTRVDGGVRWFLDTVSRHSRSWLAATAAVGSGGDPEVDAILAAADERTADTLLALVGLSGVEAGREQLRAMFRAYGGLARAAAREWLERGSMSRRQVHLLLSTSLITLVESVFPQIATEDSTPVR
jgi:AcrR family transcriptional regulator